MTSVPCPNCGSDRTRRGGNRVWAVYLVMIATAILAVFIFELNAAIVAGVILAVIVATNLIFNQRVCLDCGHQWQPVDDKPR